MISFLTSTRIMMPWTKIYASIYWLIAAWDSGNSAYRGFTGKASLWWRRRAATMNPPPFKGFRGTTQGYPVPPKILYVVVDEVMRHWVMVVVEEEAGPDGFGRVARSLAALLYGDDILIGSTRVEMLQQALNYLTDLFDRVGLQKNTQKKVGMI